MQSLIVFSQYRWDFALRRPQHLMTRLARGFRVFYFEEPVYDARGAWLEIRVPATNVHVCRPHTRIAERGFADAQMPVLAELLEKLITSHDLGTPVVWMYTSQALPLLQRLDAKAIVHDCIAEPLAPPEIARDLAQRELSLLRIADLVFTGGPSLFRLKQALHDNVHCLPSSVDKEHFAAAAHGGDHPEQAAFAHPRLGFFGVIDQRFDPVAVSLLADAHPDWQIVLVGPVADVDLRSLPRRPNIHYMGERPYAELPQFVAGWDVCLLPFAMNAATRHGSPAKVLEYMAAGKPIVTAPLPDVVEPFGHIVHVGRHAQSFVSACERALEEPAAMREKRAAMMRNVVKATSWDATAAKMRALIEDVAHRQHRRRSPALQALTRPTEHRRSVVVGAGPAGLSAAWHLGASCLLLEQHDKIGGSCRSFVEGGFNFDHGGRAMASADPAVHAMYARLLGENLAWHATLAEPGAPRLALPRRGGMQAVMDGFLPQLRGELRLNARVARLSASRHVAVLADGSSYRYDGLIGTLPLPMLVDLLGDEAPTRVRRAAGELQYESSRWIHLGLADGRGIRPGAARRQRAHGLVRRIVVLDGAALACEIPYSRRDPLPGDGDALLDRCIAECVRGGILDAEALVPVRHQVDAPFSGVLSVPGQDEHVETIRQWLRARDIELAGEFAEWRDRPEHPFLAGMRAASRLAEALARKAPPAGKARPAGSRVVAVTQAS
ncbi:MAG TPA: FAD-dependent oxidoreductase [Steroidobacteraceae bacterium]|nr:FAD-dependent oxidoreductase [Steroidobacteraceae bacterium]